MSTTGIVYLIIGLGGGFLVGYQVRALVQCIRDEKKDARVTFTISGETLKGVLNRGSEGDAKKVRSK